MPDERPTEATQPTDATRTAEAGASTPPDLARPDDDAPGNFVDDPSGEIPEPNEPA